MSYTPHTSADIEAMLSALGAESVEALFDEIPASLKLSNLDIGQGQTEMSLSRLINERAKQDPLKLNFVGGGAYEHFIPAAVWPTATRGELMTAYTPYQAEASQGALQLFYEYQTMMTRLMAMDVSNASLYDGASSLAEAVLMAIRCHKRHARGAVLMPNSLHPNYRKTVRTMLEPQHIPLQEVNFDANGLVDDEDLARYAQNGVSALVIAQPNFFGRLEDVDRLTDWAHEQGALVIAAVNPLAMAWLKPPGEWGLKGADISCGEGQSLGIPLAYGGPYYGFMCCRNDFIRHLPGRIVGRTVDAEGHIGYTLTLQPREQHIRRAKATSNICTNQGLMVTASTLYMALMGDKGLLRAAQWSHVNSERLFNQLIAIKGVTPAFEPAPFYHEFVIQLPCNARQLIEAMNERDIEAGYPLAFDYPGLKDCLLVCATETKTQDDLAHYAQSMADVIQELA